MVDICCVRQKEQLGLGHAVLTAKNVVGNEPFILFLPDDIFPDGATTLKKMIDICGRYESSVLAVKEVPVKLTPQPEGEWRWVGTKTILFEPALLPDTKGGSNRFPMATEYRVEIPAGARDASGT